MSYTIIAYSVLAGIIPSCIWLAFWLREDVSHPEPRWLIGASFIGGALAIIAAIFAEKYIGDIVSDRTLRYSLWAATEEIIKFIVVAIVALNSRWNDEPIDAMIYMITVALGFAAVENALFIFAPLSGGDIAQGIAMNSMRFIGATLVHIVSSAMIGFALGYTLYRRKAIRAVAVVIGLISAIALHAGFNISIISAGPDGVIKTFVWIWVSAILLLILFEEVKAVKPKTIIHREMT